MYFDISHLTCDSDSRHILAAVDFTPRSVREISQQCHLPLTRCYRIVREMEHKHMLRRAGLRGARGTAYLSNIQSLGMAIEDDRLYFSIEFRDGERSKVELSEENLQSPRSGIPQALFAVGASIEPSTIS